MTKKEFDNRSGPQPPNAEFVMDFTGDEPAYGYECIACQFAVGIFKTDDGKQVRMKQCTHRGHRLMKPVYDAHLGAVRIP